MGDGIDVRDAPTRRRRLLRVAVLSELPTPYRWPLFQRVAEQPGLDVTVLYYSRNESDRDWAMDVRDSASCRVEFLPGRALHVRRRRSLFFHWNPGIGRRLREGRFDVVVVPGWSMPTSIAAIVSCRMRRVPYVVFSETNDLTPRPRWLRGLKRVVLRPLVGGASAWLATGTMSARFLVAHGAREERVRRFANTPDVAALARDVDAARARRAATRRSLDVPEDAVVAVFVGRLIGVKDVATLVRAHALAESAGSALLTLVVGDGVERPALEALAAQCGATRIRFAGARRPAELPDLWAASDLFVLPSLHEPWGVVVNEALAAGLPIVLSDRVGSGPDLLVPGGTGLSFAAGDERALSAALVRLASDREERARMSVAAREMASRWGYGPSVEGFEQAVRLAAGEAA